jgi:hypothetical protein
MSFSAHRNRGNYRNVQLLRPGAKKQAGRLAGQAHKDGSDKQTKQTPIRHGPYKLGPEFIEKFCPGIPIEAICDSLGIGRATFYEWLQEAKLQPGTIYETFAREVTQAMSDSWQSLHTMAIKARPEQILFRRYQSFYPSERVQADLTSAGMPLLPQTFNVLMELHKPDDNLEFKIEPENVIELPKQALP